jgi:hypothetical protein
MTINQIPKLPNPNDFHSVDELRTQLNHANEAITSMLVTMKDMIDTGQEYAAAYRLLTNLIHLKMKGDISGINQILSILVIQEKLKLTAVDRSNDFSATAAERPH